MSDLRPMALHAHLKANQHYSDRVTYNLDIAVATIGDHNCPWGMDSYDANQKALDGLTITAYLTVKGDPEVDRSWWGWSLGYRDAHHVDLDRAKAMVRILTRVNKAMDKYHSDFGYPKNLMEYVGRIASTLKITNYVVKSSPKRKEMTGESWRLMNGSEFQYWLDEIEREKRKEHQ